jgi:hypothetical protein
MRRYRTSLGGQMAQSSSVGLPEFLKSNQLCTILGFNEWSMSEIAIYLPNGASTHSLNSLLNLNLHTTSALCVK